MPAIKIILRKYPELVKALENRHINYNNSLDYIEKLEKEGKLFVLAPDEILPVGKTEHDPQKLKATYEIGRSCGLKNLDAIKQFLMCVV